MPEREEIEESSPAAETPPAGHGETGIEELSDEGVGAGAGEPNTFEPEEPAAEV